MMKAIDLRKGRTLVYEGNLFVVHDMQRVSKGNWRSYVQTKLKNLKSGQIIDVRFGVDDKVETPFLETKEYEYLYRDGNDFVFMDTTTFDQLTIMEDQIGDAAQFLKANEKVSAQVHEDKIVTIELPQVVELMITETPPVVKGATATNQPKDAILETGARVRVPAFIEPGERIRVDTRSGEYVERVK
ncbi:MAG TPA: elongation factor P [Phycisphaerae bacterium]|jgi:elongation factor P